jgi:radical SAM superfamily enzyme YgiQ (UPF0313 family)
MRLYLINPRNPLVGIVKMKQTYWNRFRIWKPLGLLVLAGLTPPEWEVSILDENVATKDYSTLPPPDLVGITAFTSQVNRAYELADYFKKRGVPVVMGGIHASMCVEESMAHVDSIVTGEAEAVWADVLADVKNGTLKRRYDGGFADVGNIPLARHDLLSDGYFLGSIQTTRGCPLNCTFCSVTSFNGSRYRQRAIADVVKEFQMIREKNILVVDDNFVGTRSEHIDYTKELFRAMIRAKLKKRWMGQVTINFADDDELMALAKRAGCAGVFIGFESATTEGLAEIGKKFNHKGDSRDFRASVRAIKRHGIVVIGSFIIGLDVDKPGIGGHVAEVAAKYNLDLINVLLLTPLPGTRLWAQMVAENRIVLNSFPADWKYYTLNYPVAKFKYLTQSGIIKEILVCTRRFYSSWRTLGRVIRNFLQRRAPIYNLVANLSFWGSIRSDLKIYESFLRQESDRPGEHAARLARS